MTRAKKLLAIPPGEILAEEFMKAHRVSQNRLARDIDVNPARINDIARPLGHHRLDRASAREVFPDDA
jgi:plasmid maintenance system antidote protein VapI